MRLGRFLVLLSALAGVLFHGDMGPVAWTQENSYKKIVRQGKKAYSIPVSQRTVQFEVILPSGKPAKLLVEDGGMAKTGDLEQGYAYALVPIIKDMGKKTASFTVFQLMQDENGNESIRQLERVDVGPDRPMSLKAAPGLQVRVTSIDEPKASLAGEAGSNLQAASKSNLAKRCGSTQNKP